MKYKLFSFLDKFNLFKSPFHFYINSNDSLTSGFGSILSFLIFFFLIFMFINSDMIKHTNPKIFDEIIANKAPKITLNNRNFAPVIMISESFTNLSFKNFAMDGSYFEIVVDLFANNNNNVSKIKSYNVHECTSKDFNNEIKYKDYYEGGYCFLSSNEDLELVGQENFWFGKIYFFTISLRICSNITFNNSCKPLDEILDFIEEKNFSLDFIDSTFVLENFENPEHKNYENYLVAALNRNIITKKSLSLMEVDLHLDDSFLFGEEKFEKYIQQDASQKHFEVNYKTEEEYKNDRTLAEFKFSPSYSKRVLRRRYQKIIELFSLLGGLASFLHFIGTFIADLFLHKKALLLFVNKLYKYNENSSNLNTTGKDSIREDNINEEIKDKFQLNESSIFNLGSFRSRNQKDLQLEMKSIGKNSLNIKDAYMQKEFIGDSIISENKKKFQSFKYVEILKKTQDKILPFSISFFEYVKFGLKSIFCKTKFSKKEKMIEKCEEVYKNELELYNILMKIKEIDILKEILLDEQEIKIFNSIPRPLMSLKLNAENENQKEIETQKSSFFLSYLEDISVNKSHLSEFDKKILNYFQKNNNLSC